MYSKLKKVSPLALSLFQIPFFFKLFAAVIRFPVKECLCSFSMVPLYVGECSHLLSLTPEMDYGTCSEHRVVHMTTTNMRCTPCGLFLEIRI